MRAARDKRHVLAEDVELRAGVTTRVKDRKRALVVHPANPLLMLVPLARGRGHAVIDVQDADEVARFNWRAKPSVNTTYAKAWAIGDDGARGTVYLHQLIARRSGFADSPEIDHRNGNGLDCRRRNLRAATRAQNGWNLTMRSDNSSGVKGVCRTENGKWRAYVTVGGKQRSLGRFLTVGEADAAVRACREQLHGEFANHGIREVH